MTCSREVEQALGSCVELDILDLVGSKSKLFESVLCV